jgi:hypothetical protein
LLGDRLVNATGVPVALIPASHGGTSVVRDWQVDSPITSATQDMVPTGATTGYLQARLKNVLFTLRGYGVRAVLWHQGEADNYAASDSGGIATYVQSMQSLISASRSVASMASLPWLVSQVSKTSGAGANPTGITSDPLQAFAGTIAAQRQVIASTASVYLGAQTDQFGWVFRRSGIYSGNASYAADARAGQRSWDFLHFTDGGQPACGLDASGTGAYTIPGAGTQACNGLAAIAYDWEKAVRNAFFGGSFTRLP